MSFLFTITAVACLHYYTAFKSRQIFRLLQYINLPIKLNKNRLYRYYLFTIHYLDRLSVQLQKMEGKKIQTYSYMDDMPVAILHILAR